MKLIRDLLLTIGVPVSHYFAEKKPDKYIVWAEDSQSDELIADDETVEQVIQGTIDYYTKEEYDINAKKIQKALNSAQIKWRLNSVQYEEETKFIHYEWVWDYGELCI